MNSQLSAIVADLDRRLETAEGADVDLLKELKRCITTPTPIPQDLQDQYYAYLGREQAQDQYTHLEHTQ